MSTGSVGPAGPFDASALPALALTLADISDLVQVASAVVVAATVAWRWHRHRRRQS